MKKYLVLATFHDACGKGASRNSSRQSTTSLKRSKLRILQTKVPTLSKCVLKSSRSNYSACRLSESQISLSYSFLAAAAILEPFLLGSGFCDLRMRSNLWLHSGQCLQCHLDGFIEKGCNVLITWVPWSFHCRLSLHLTQVSVTWKFKVKRNITKNLCFLGNIRSTTYDLHTLIRLRMSSPGFS